MEDQHMHKAENENYWYVNALKMWKVCVLHYVISISVL